MVAGRVIVEVQEASHQVDTVVAVRHGQLRLADRAQPPGRRERQPGRVERLELVLLGDLDPGTRIGEWPERPQPIDVGCRRRLGEHRHARVPTARAAASGVTAQGTETTTNAGSADSSSSVVRYPGTAQSWVITAARSASRVWTPVISNTSGSARATRR